MKDNTLIAIKWICVTIIIIICSIMYMSIFPHIININLNMDDNFIELMNFVNQTRNKERLNIEYINKTNVGVYNTTILNNWGLFNITPQVYSFYTDADEFGCRRYRLNVSYVEVNLCDGRTYIVNGTDWCISKQYSYTPTNECVKHTTAVRGDCGDIYKDNECYVRYMED